MFVGVIPSTPPIPSGRDPSVPKIGTTYMRAHNMRENNQILHGNQTRCD